MAVSSPYSIRPYSHEDLPRLQEITANTFGPVSIDRNMEVALGRFGGGDWCSRKTADVAEDCRIQPDGVLVAVGEGNCVVGYVTTRLLSTSGIGWIHNLAVDPRHQGRGIGRSLLEAAISMLRERRMSVAKIETLEQNPVGQALYPTLGFQEVGRQIHYAMRLDQQDRGEE